MTSRAAYQITATWIDIHIRPMTTSSGRLASLRKSICMPMQAIRKYRKTVPTLDAPASSSRRTRVKLNIRPPRVESTTTQTNGASRLNCEDQGALALNQADAGSAMACDRPTMPKAQATITIRSDSTGMRAFAASWAAMRCFISSSALVSAPLRASMASARFARNSRVAISRLAMATSTTANCPNSVASTS